VFPHGVPPDGTPEWPERTQEEQVRHFGLERFVDAVRVVVIHLRVDKRLAMLRALFDRVGNTVDAIGALVDLWDDEEAMHAAIGDTDGDGDVDADDRVALRFAVETTQRFAFPSYRESEFADREPIDTMETIPVFEELDTFPLKVPQEASMMGYRQWETPVLPFHFPAAVVPEIRVGAQEESILRKPCRLPEDMVAASAAIEEAGLPKQLALPVRAKVS
jgi:hypothetical protein